MWPVDLGNLWQVPEVSNQVEFWWLQEHQEGQTLQVGSALSDECNHECNLHQLEPKESLYQAAGGAISASEGNDTEEISLGESVQTKQDVQQWKHLV